MGHRLELMVSERAGAWRLYRGTGHRHHLAWLVEYRDGQLMGNHAPSIGITPGQNAGAVKSVARGCRTLVRYRQPPAPAKIVAKISTDASLQPPAYCR